MGKFLHISFDFKNETKIFIPIVYGGLIGECNFISRICVAGSLEGCLYVTPLFEEIFHNEDLYAILGYLYKKQKNMKQWSSNKNLYF